MNAYRVRYKVKDGGYKHPDMVNDGGYFDTDHSILVYASSSRKARDQVRNWTALTQPSNRVIVHPADLVMEDV